MASGIRIFFSKDLISFKPLPVSNTTIFEFFVIAEEVLDREIPGIQINNIHPQKSRLKITVISAKNAKSLPIFGL